MRVALLASCASWAFFAAVLGGCDPSSSAEPPKYVHVGCEAGSGCAEDFTLKGVCAQDRSHLCFCPGDAGDPTGNPSGDCLGTEVRPPAPYSRGVCCP